MSNQKLSAHLDERIKALESATLMDLLIGQCTDLETLLALARREKVAADAEDFDQLLSVAGERATVGDRLESYHRQISELRETLDQSAIANHDLGQKAMHLAVAVQAQDAQTTALLLTMRARTSEAIARLDVSHRNSGAYLHNGPAGGSNCDRRA